jgi:hypothetical protein
VRATPAFRALPIFAENDKLEDTMARMKKENASPSSSPSGLRGKGLKGTTCIVADVIPYCLPASYTSQTAILDEAF